MAPGPNSYRVRAVRLDNGREYARLSPIFDARERRLHRRDRYGWLSGFLAFWLLLFSGVLIGLVVGW